MSGAEFLMIPLEARRYQGSPSGIVTRVAANTLDVLVVMLVLVGVYCGYAALRFVLTPREFQMPAPSLLWLQLAFFALLVVYLTAAWWFNGRTLGDHVMGIRVVGGRTNRVPFARALGRALLCVVFPIGLLWCAVDGRRRSVQDLAFGTSVVYDWLPRPSSA